jgi:hypothetical protein
MASDTCKPCGGQPSPGFGTTNNDKIEPGLYKILSSGSGRYWKMKSHDQHNRMETRPLEWQEEYFSFQIHQRSDNTLLHAARNIGHNKYVEVDGDHLEAVQADSFNFWNGNHVFVLQSLGECGRYYMKFQGGGSQYVYEEENSTHNVKVQSNRNGEKQAVIFEKSDKCFQDDNNCLNVNGEYHYCDFDTDRCTSCGGQPSPGFGRTNNDKISPGTYMFRSSGSGRYWKMQNKNSNNRISTHSSIDDDVAYFKYKVYQRSDNTLIHAARNNERNKFIEIDGDHLEGVKASNFNFYDGDQVFILRSLGECGRYYMKFKGGSQYVYEEDNSTHNVKQRSSTNGMVVVYAQRV